MSDNITPPLIGAQIRNLRKQQGLSLKQLATRAGTSAPALHRYETGWDRFELATLRRIAAALGARCEVRLVPEDTATRPKGSRTRQLQRLLAPLFWDRRLTEDDLDAHPRWVLARVLMYGNREQMAAARGYYGDGALRDASRQRGIDERTKSYWTVILDAD